MSGPAFEPISGDIVVAAPQASDGGTINFNFDGITPNRPLPREPFTTVPFLQDRDFIERPDVSALLREKCDQPGSRVALVGLGGVGKSQLAIQYAHQVRQQSASTYVFWVHTSTRPRFELAYCDIANRLQLPGRLDPKTDVLQLVYNWLSNEANGAWLMILDNADDVDVFYPKSYGRNATASLTQLPLASYIPQCNNGRILITSRNSKVAEKLTGGSQNIISIPVMNNDQAKQLLRTKLGDKYDEQAATGLVQAFERMPLAIMQATAYILRPTSQTSPSEYLDKFCKSDKRKASLLNKDMGDLRRDPSAANSVVMTWQITFEQIQQERPSAADLLLFTSFLNPQGIPLWLLQSYRQRRQDKAGGSDADSGDDSDNDKFEEDLEILREYSLITATTERGVFEMHALVQFCTRVWLSSVDNIDKWRCLYLEVMRREYPTGAYRNWIKCQQIDPHIEMALELEPGDEEEAKDLAQLLMNAGSFRFYTGKYAEAEKLLGKAIDLRVRIFSSGHVTTLQSVGMLANVLQRQGRYEESEQMRRRALDGYKKILGEKHQQTLICMGNLAQVLQDQSKYYEAEQVSRQALDGFEKILGENSSDTIISSDILANVLYGQGKYSEAEQMSRQALSGFEKVLGQEHPETLTNVVFLANVLLKQGKCEEAEQMNRRALGGYEKALGAEHSYTLVGAGSLAAVLRYQGKCDEAEQMGRRAHSGLEKVLGQDHPQTVISIGILARVLHKKGQYDEAEEMSRRVLDHYKKVLGEDHQLTLQSADFLAAVLRDQGKYDEADQMSRLTLENRGDTVL